MIRPPTTRRCSRSPARGTWPSSPASNCRPPGVTSTPIRSSPARAWRSTPVPPPSAQVLQEARREGATVVQVNHPFIPYGYFSSVAAGVAPGGFDGGFDLVEINSTVPGDDAKVLARLWDYWNEGRHYYLTGGSDTHDVWNEQSGRIRTFVHSGGPGDRRSVRRRAQGRPRLRDLRTDHLSGHHVRQRAAGHGRRALQRSALSWGRSPG